MEQTTTLEDAQVAAFERDGYLVVPALLSAEEMRHVSAWTDELAALPETPGRHMVYHEQSESRPGLRVLSRIENFADLHVGFGRLLSDSRISRCAARLMGGEVVLFKEKINFKPPGGNGFRPHQDVQAGWDRYAPLHLTMLLAIDAADRGNGCLEVVPGAHRHGLLGEMWKPLPEAVEGLQYRPCETAPGDAVFFGSYLPHRSGPNLSEQPRRVLYVTWNLAAQGDHRQRYWADKRAAFPPDVEREPGRRYEFRV